MKRERFLKDMKSKGLVPIYDIGDKINVNEKCSLVDKDGYKYHLSHNTVYHSDTNIFLINSIKNKYSIENIQHYIHLQGSSTEVITQEYKGNGIPLTLRCGICGKTFDRTPNKIISCNRFDCKECSIKQSAKRKVDNSKDKVAKFCNDLGFNIIDSTYKNCKSFDMIDSFGYKYGTTSVFELHEGHDKVKRFSIFNKYQLDNMKLYLLKHNLNATIINEDNISAKHDLLTVACIECGNHFHVKWHNLIGDNENNIPVIKCKKCSRRMSSFEYVVAQYLDELDIEYITEQRFEWCKKEKMLPFDFYIPSLNLVIEVQGQQHYIECNFFDRGLTKQKEYDNHKKEKCKQNKVKYLAIPYWTITDKERSFKQLINNAVGLN